MEARRAYAASDAKCRNTVLINLLVVLNLVNCFWINEKPKLELEFQQNLSCYFARTWNRNFGSHFGLKPKRKFCKSRTPYYNSQGVASFQLLNNAAILLILSGNIHPHPGPVKNPCAVCQKPVARTHRALTCNGCGLRCHIGNKCGNFPEEQYKQLGKKFQITWYCPPCINLNIYGPVQKIAVNVPRPRRITTDPETINSVFHDPKYKFPRKGFSFFHLNTCSLLPKIDEIRQLAIENPFHIITISETWLDKSVSNSEISIQGYSDPLRCDREYGNRGGSVAAYFKSSVKHKELLKKSSPEFEALAIKVSPSNSPSFLIIVAYRPSSQTNLEPHVTKFLDHALDLVPEVSDIVLMGDLNLNQLEINNYTKEMDHICQTYNLQQLIDIPTRITSSTSSLIDLLYVSEPSYIAESGVFQLSISDHFGIYGVREKQTNGSHNKQQDHVLVKFRDFKAFSEEKFLDDINSAPWQLLDVFEGIDDKLVIFYQLIYHVLDWHAPKCQRRVRKESYPWISSCVIEAIRRKSYALQMFLRCKSDLAWNFYKRARNEATTAIRNSKKEYFLDAIQNNEENPKQLWKILKRLLPSKKVKYPENILFEGKRYTKKEDISNCFNQFFSNVARKITSHVPPPQIDTTVKLSQKLLDLPSVSPRMILKLLQS